MSITTRHGYRKSQVAKKYQTEIRKQTGKEITLRQARKETEIIQKIVGKLAPLKEKDRIKVLKAVAILHGI